MISAGMAFFCGNMRVKGESNGIGLIKQWDICELFGI